mgnify:CR=1 FL=1
MDFSILKGDEERDRQIAEKEERDEFERRETKLMQHFRVSGIGERYLSITKDSFDLSNENFKHNYEIVLRYINAVHDRNSACNLVLHGTSNGTGKTALSALICRECYGVYTHLYNICNELEDARKFSSSRTRVEVLARYTTASMLIIDEVARDASPDEKAVLFQIIDRRYSDCLPTVLVSNLEKGKLKDWFGNATLERIGECGAFISFDNIPSYREVLKERK